MYEMEIGLKIKFGKFDQEALLILGANGQLGKALRLKYPEAKFADSNELDITDVDALENYDWDDVKYVINAAAYTNVDGAETPEGRPLNWKVNAEAVKNLAKIAKKHDLTLVHISSDYVFDGSKNIHTEDEDFAPLNSYGSAKAAGDIAATITKKHYIVRTSWVVGDGKNFVNTMLELAERGISPSVVSDQIGRLTFTSELVRAIDHILSKNLDYGTYNVTNSGESASWADITRKIFELSGHENLTVTDVTTEEYFAGKENIARRPLQSTLDLTKIQNSGFKSKDWEEALAEYIIK